MRTNHIILTDAIAELNDRAPHVIGSIPLWCLTSRSFGFEVTVHLPDEYVGLPGTSTAGDVTWMILEAREAVDVINKALDQLAAMKTLLMVAA
ncbi:MAG: hypothetical protein JWN03_7390 [Nocardia sp.]|uniref:hypothetical protein n=1 Tax=Nocardia sp. TaxID=1821 RepID=UPI0026174D3B|nr:hypothetical protein [Nocardia sp.]MCU1647115.1 hypothetical protein [Nocardia sp.]